jgi:hypothetical protein
MSLLSLINTGNLKSCDSTCFVTNQIIGKNVDPGPRNGGKKSGKEGKKQTNQQPPLSYRYLAFIHHL